ncbi:MAG: Zinc uptake regulation protein [Alphaproteobacteria bacterium MarineAlpha11_Bin1]|nr:MAG: Zinc uptake regulation protein [Alphaproteobacteria bacterium MarineAlpha11_Bin1]|tara:strand:- start:1138 stop:1638 length:501 start_codon:yes stop_codon:yes gene_type:complete
MSFSNPLNVFPQPGHDHDLCASAALKIAEDKCRLRGLRFTPLRRRVLEIVWAQHGPSGAYDILGKLRGDKQKAAPPTVYRALEFLVENGFVHKIESLNAFVGCGGAEQSHNSQFLICGKCNQIGELDDPEISALIEKKAKNMGFRVDQPTVEIMGLCSACKIESDA